MARLMRQRGLLRSILLGTALAFVAGVSLGQEAEPANAGAAERPQGQQNGQEPTTQPTSAPTTQLDRYNELRETIRQRREERARQLAERREQARKGIRQPASETRPVESEETAPALTTDKLRALEELRLQARLSTQRATTQPTTRPVHRPDAEESDIRIPDDLAPEDLETDEQPTERPSPTRAPHDEGARARRARQGEAAAEEPAAEQPGGEWFAFDQMPWEDVVRTFARRIGKPLMHEDDLVIGGELTYHNTRILTKEEALDELNLLLHEMGYRFVETEHHIFVVPLSEMPQYVPVKQVFASVAEFEQAKPRDMDYSVVYIKIEGQPAERIQEMFGASLPDYALLSVVGQTNQLKVQALARDVRKLLVLMDRIKLDAVDPRPTKIFEIRTNARDIEQLVRQILGVGQQQRRYDRQTRQWVTEGPESDVRITADDRTNTLVIKAAPDQLAEIEKFIKEIDKKPDIGEFFTKVTEIRYANATEVANLLNQIFQQEQGQQPAWQRYRTPVDTRTRRGMPQQPQPQPQPQPRVTPQGAAPEDLLGEGIFERAKKTIRIVAYEPTNTIAVYANADGHKRVEEMLTKIDVLQPSNYRTFKLENGNAEEVYATVSQIVQSLRAVSVRGATRPASVVLDQFNNTLHVIADRDDMQNIEMVIKELDVAAEEGERHVVELVNLTPSRVAELIRPLLETRGSSSGGVTPMPRMRTRGGGVTPPTRSGTSAVRGAQIIPLDEAQILIVICAPEDWVKIEETIKLWDERAISSSPELRWYTIEKGDAAAIANRLSLFYANYQHPALGRSQVLVSAEGNTLYVQGVKPALDELEALLPTLDVEDTSQLVILPLANADATQVAQYLQTFFGAVRGPRGPRGMPAAGGGGGPSIEAEPVTNALIVRADTVTLERIKDFAQRMDEKVGADLPAQKIFTPRYVPARDVATAIQTMYMGGRDGRTPRGTQVKAAVVGAQVVVEAPQEKIAEIEAFITQLDDPKGNEVVIRTVKMAGADVSQIAARLNAAFALKSRQQTVVARFDADPSSETILLTYTKDMEEEVDRLLNEYEEAYKGSETQLAFRALSHAQATDVAPWLRTQLLTAIQKQYGRGAAQQIEVTAEPRTNRVVINAPKVAVELAMGWLDQYDVEAPEVQVSPVDTKTYKLPGADVDSLARNLAQIFNNKPPRPDKLRAVFAADPGTETILVSAPKDEFAEIEQRIGEYRQETADLVPVERFLPVRNADANYVASQVRTALDVKIRSSRGQNLAGKLNISVDTRLNQLLVYGPKFAVEMAEKLVAELDIVQTDPTRLVQTIPLENADANAVNQVLQAVMREKIQQTRTLQISVEPTTNALIVTGSKEDVAEVRRCAEDWDTRAKGFDLAPATIPLQHLDPHQTAQMINQMFAVRGGSGKNPQQEVQATVSNNVLIVKAPPKKLAAIKDLVAEIDTADSTGVEIRTYDLKVLNATQVAAQVQLYLRSVVGPPRPGQLQPGAFGEPTTNTLVVISPAQHLPFIETLVKDLESKRGNISEPKTYTLKFARAEQIAQNVEAMLRAKVTEREGPSRQQSIQTSVVADARTNRLMVYAPEEYQRLAEELVRMLDEDIQAGDIVHIITLQTGDAAQMAQSLNQVIAGMRTPTGSPGGRAGAATVRVTPDAASNSIILGGMPRDLAEVEKWIKELESQSAVIPELQIFQLKASSATDVVAALTAIFPKGRTAADTVTATPDDYYNRVVVTANRRSMRQVEAIIEQLDVLPDDEGKLGIGDKELYFVDITRGDATDIAWEIEELLPPEDKGGPKIDADWFGKYIKVTCRPSEFPRIERLIHEFESRARVERKFVIRDLKGDPSRLIPLLQARNPDAVFKVTDTAAPAPETIVEPLWAEGEEPPGVKKSREKNKEKNKDAKSTPVKQGVHPCYLPLPQWIEELTLELRAQEAGPAGQGGQPVAKPERKPSQASTTQPAVQTAKPESTARSADAPGVSGSREQPRSQREAAELTLLPDGRVLISGPTSEVDEIGDAIDVLLEDLDVGEVIRIFQFRYGDVNAAAQVLDRMFNERQVIRLPQQPQQPQQPGRQRGQQGEGQDRDQQPGQQQGLLDQLRGMVGGRGAQPGEGRGAAGGSQVRIATDPSHDYLIVKCAESLLPEIRRLLRELDIPPGEVDIRVFQLRSLDAAETAENIKAVLGISRAQSRRTGPLGQAAGPRAGGPQQQQQQQLMEILQQQMVTISGVEGGARVESVEVVPNAVTNSVMVSAPPDVMEIIDRVISDLEALEGRDVIVIRHYALKQARIDDILPLLEEIFAATAGSGGAGRGPRAGGVRSPGALGPVTVSGDPRTNTVIYTAEAKDVEVVEKQIATLDIAGSLNEAETYVVQYGDAAAIADVVEAIYGDAGAGRSRPGRGGQPAAGGGSEVRIVAESSTNTIVVWGPPDKRELIFAKIAELDKLNKLDVREIPVIYADPEELADKLMQIVGGSGGVAAAAPGGPRGPRGQRGARPAAASAGRVVIMGDTQAKKLLVRAPDHLYKQIAELVATLDQPSEQLLIKRFELAHANAEIVVEDVKQALQDYMAVLQRTGKSFDMDAFTAVADPRTNSIVVVGSQETFLFVQQVLAAVDVETPPEQEKQMRIFVLEKADAATVADAINSLSATGGAAGGGPRPGGRGGRGGGPGGVGGKGGELNVQAAAEPATNAVMVYGTPEDIAKVEASIIKPFEEISREGQPFFARLKYARATTVAETLDQFFRGQSGRAGGGRGPGGTRLADQVSFSADPDTNTLIVLASGTNREFVEKLIAELDQEEGGREIEVFQLQFADANSAADVIQTTFEERAGPGGRGGRTGAADDADRVIATPDVPSNTVIVRANPANMNKVRALIEELEGTIAAGYEPVTIKVYNAPASQVASFIWQFLSDRTGEDGAAGRRGGRPGGAQGVRRGPQMIPNDNAGTLVVRGTPAEVERIRSLAEKFDDPNLVGNQIKVIKVPLGQDVATLASEVERVVNEGERLVAEQQGRTPREVAIGADDYSHTIIVAGDPAQFGTVDAVVQQLAQIRTDETVTRIITFTNLSADNAVEMIDNLQQQQRGGTSGRSGVTRPRGSSTTPRQRPSTPPSGTRRRPTGRGAFLWSPQPRELSPASGPAWGQPVVGAMPFSSVAVGALLALMVADPLPPNSIDAFIQRNQRTQSAALRFRPVPAALVRANVDELWDMPAANWSFSERAIDRRTEPAVNADTLRGERVPVLNPARKPGAGQSASLRLAALNLLDDQSQEKPKPRKSQTQPTTQPVRPQREATKREESKLRSPQKEQTKQDTEPAALRRAQTQETADEQERAERPARGQLLATRPLFPPPATQPTGPLPSISGTLRGEVIATPLDSRRIVISGDASDVEFIERMLAGMEQAAPQAMIEVFALKYAKAATLGEVLTKAVQARLDLYGPAGAADQFSISAEARSNSLVVAASEPNMALIEEMIERLDLPTTTESTQFKAVPLLNVRAIEAVAQLKPVIERLNKIRDVPAEAQASIQAVDRSNSVLIVGTPADISEIERLVEAIDIELEPEDERSDWSVGEMVIVGLKNGQAEDVAKVLTDMIKAEQEAAQKAAGAEKPGDLTVRRLRLKTADGRELPELNLERPIRIIAEKGTNSLIVYSSPKNNESLKEIVDVFDTLPVGPETDVRAFVLEHASAERVVEVLKEVFDEGKKALARPSDGEGKGLEKGKLPPVPPGLASKGLPYNVVVTHDARSNTVFVIGRRDAVLLAAGVIQEVDRATTDLGLTAQVLSLKNIQATRLAEMLTDMLDKRQQTLDSKKGARDSAVIIPDDRSNAIVVLATQEVHDLVEDLTTQLDSADSYRIVGTEYRRLSYADAQKVQGLLQEVFDRKKEAEGQTKSETKDVLFATADARSNSIMLTGTRDYLDEASKFIGELDRSFDPTVEVKVRPVKLNSALNIATLLQETIDKSLAQKDSKLSGTPIHIAADPLSDSLLIAASHEDMVMLERWIEVLDRPSEVGRMTRIIPLRRGSAEDISKAVQDLFKGGGGSGGKGGGASDVTVTFDASTNSVVAHGPAAVLEDIAGIVKRLDETEVMAGAVVRIFKLEQAAAEDAGELLMSILEGRGGVVSGRGSRGGTGGGSRQDAVNQVMLIYQREYPELGTATLKAMRTEVVVIADVRTNSLVVVAPPDSIELMESLVAAVDVPPDAAKIRVFPLRNADAEEMVVMLRELFEEQATGGRTGGRTGGGGGGGTGVAEGERQLVFEGGALGEGGRQVISFTTDARTNSVIAAGTTGYLDLVEELILNLDTKPIEERKTMVYSPRNTVAESLASSVKEYSDAEKSRLQEMAEEISIQRRQEREIVAIPNEDANVVILGYSPRYEGDVLDIVRELDQPPPQVMIQVLIVEVTMDNSLELGVEFAFQDLQFTKAGPTDTTTFDFVGGTDIGAAGTGLGGFTFTVTGADFNFLMRTLQNEGNLSILSRPQIVAMDNQEATIEIVNDVPYISGSSTSIAGQITTQVARQDVGIKLVVTPQINPDGFVRLEINQEVSDITGSTVDVGQGLTAPIFFRRVAETTVTVKDNETVVLGGLITSREETREQKVPILGDIPGLGLLFRNDVRRTSRTELLVILTPRIVRTIEDYRELSIAERDQAHILSSEVATNPLMQGLRVKPEDLLPPKGEDLLGPFPPESPDSGAPDEEAPNGDEYGPRLSPALREEISGARLNPNSYDVPVVVRTKGGRVARK